jgi:hypothetical protein
VILHFLGGLGDELLLTCVARELRKRNPELAVWQISAAAELLRGNPDYSLVLDRDHWELRHSNVLGVWRKPLRYSEMLIQGRYELPPREHILAALCRAAGIAGRVQLRPWYFQSREEAARGRHAPRQIAVQCVGVRTHETWMANKAWFADRFQSVIDALRRNYPDTLIVQLGGKRDPALQGVLDLRGATGLRQTAAALSQSECFIGTSGFLIHLARAVECRSVVVYGGREHAWQSGYPCNENLESRPQCAPCWLWHDCDFERQCMRDIAVDDVVHAVVRAIGKKGQPLAVEEASLNEVASVPSSYPAIPGSQLIAKLAPFRPMGPH